MHTGAYTELDHSQTNLIAVWPCRCVSMVKNQLVLQSVFHKYVAAKRALENKCDEWQAKLRRRAPVRCLPFCGVVQSRGAHVMNRRPPCVQIVPRQLKRPLRLSS